MIPRLIVVVGETASGKSALAMEIARQFNGEIINADSWQVYKGFDVGTAKPSQAEQAEIPHHLINIVEANAGFSAAAYKHLAQTAIEEIAKRGKLPVMVGGTGLYIDSVLFDFSFLPTGKAGERAKWNLMSIDELLAEIKARGIDLIGIDTRNKRRLVRLLETNGVRPEQKALRQNTLVIGLKLPRAKLRQKIEQRVETMFAKGLKYEVKQLADRYGWETEAMKGIGYQQWQAYFDQQQSLSATKRKIVKSTLDLAKRQRTWFKRHGFIEWVEAPADAIKLVRKFVE